MKKIFTIIAFTFVSACCFSQEALRVQNGGSITIQNGVNLVLQGGITLENGSGLENKGFIFLKNNSIANISDWTDNSLSGALTGTGVVIFNSDHSQQFMGLTNFYTVAINTNQLTLNNNLNIANILRLVNGKINTGVYYVFLNNNLASALETDAANTTYTNSWINGLFRRLIASNTSTYDFPVGISTRSNLLKFINSNVTGPTFLTASFGAKPGTDVGLNVTENGNVYTAVNNGGVWYLVPSTTATGGNYALQLYFNGFTGLTDNQFGILRRPDASTNAADWTIPAGSSLEPLSGAGRKVSDGFARRINISDFSQLGIGQFTPAPAAECTITGQSQVCSFSAGNTYSAPAGMTTYNWILTGNGNLTSANNGQSVTVSAGTGPSTFTLTLNTTLNGTAAQCSKTVTVTSTPVCDISGANQVCIPSQNNSYSGPANMNTYSWTINPGSTSAAIIGPITAQSVNVTATAPGTFILTLDATANGCASHCTKTVTANPLPGCDITGSSTVTAATSGNTYNAPSNMSSYNWSITGNGSIVGSNTGQSVSVTAGTAGTFTLMLSVALNGCSSTCTKTVTVNPSTTVDCSITGTSEVCANSMGNSYSGPAGMSNYAWSVTGNGTISGATNTQSVTVTAGSAGSFVLTLNATLNESSAQCGKTVTVKALPACDITGQSTVTTGSSTNVYSGPSNMSSYNWSITGNGSIVGSNTGQSVNVTAGAAGTFTLTLGVTLSGCSSTCAKTVTVNPSTTVDCSITGTNEVCANSMGNTYSGPAGMSNYAWSVTGNGTISGATNNQSVTVTAGSAGSFVLALNATLNESSAQCGKTVTVKALPACDITGQSTVTTGSSSNVYTGPSNMSSYNWSIIGNGSIVGSNTGQSVNITAGDPGTFTLSLSITANGCNSSCSKTVTVTPSTVPECTIAGAEQLCSGSTGNIYSAPPDMSNYSWSVTGNATIVGVSNASSVTVTANGLGIFNLTLETTLNGVSCSFTKTVIVRECVAACSYTQGFYGNVNGLACVNNSGTLGNASQLMQSAFGGNASVVFGNVNNRRFFTLYSSDITSGAIYRMLPGGGNAKAIDVDNSPPYDGASYADKGTWKLVPIQPNGPQTGKIKNSLLAQTITLWFNLRTSITLGTVGLADDTLITRRTTSCGSTTPVGDSVKFGLPHNVVVYLNGNNGYAATVDGLFDLANAVLGGANIPLTPSEVQQAVDVINNAFDDCRILVGTIPYSNRLLVNKRFSNVTELKATAFPNPYSSRFSLLINSPITGVASFEFFTITGIKVYEMKAVVPAKLNITIPYTGPVRFPTLLYKVTVGKSTATGIVIKPN